MRPFLLCLALAACQKPDPAAPQRTTWTSGSRIAKGIADLEYPPSPSETWAAFSPSQAEPVRLDGFTRAEPSGCTEPTAVPDAAQFKRMLASLEGHAAAEGVFEVVALANGCARLIEWRQAGEVRRWELRRHWQGAWVRAITWEFDAGVKRPSTVRRYGLQAPLDRFGEWAKDELHRKTIVKLGSPPPNESSYTHYRGEPSLYALVPGRPPRKISSNTTTQYCRADGHCDDLEVKAHNAFEGY